MVSILDPSDRFRPEKEDEEFRNYTAQNALFQRVQNTYSQMHTSQTYDFAMNRLEHWTKFNHHEMGVMDALKLLDTLIDESDPDSDLPNSVHAFQTAERIRAAHPDKDWFHLTGLIHDLGKVMAVWGEPQWATVGDTFAVGCEFSDKCVFGRESFSDNKDISHPVYSTKLGIYKEKCGMENVIMSWGHDEYMYRVLKNHRTCTLPDEALNMIRFHSFYPWHTMKDYMYLCDSKDMAMLEWVLEFNKFDLYSKSDSVPDIDAVRPYYQSLADKYVPGKIKF